MAAADYRVNSSNPCLMPSRIPSTEVPLAFVMAPDSEEDIDEEDDEGGEDD